MSHMSENAMSAWKAFIRTIRIPHMRAPTSDRYQRVRKVGRYDGFPAKYSRKDTVQSAP